VNFVDQGDRVLDWIASAEQWYRLKVCGVCSKPLAEGERTRRGFCINGPGIVLFRLHAQCGERAERDEHTQRELITEAERDIKLAFDEPGGHA
jgi:hypothetical protein